MKNKCPRCQRDVIFKADGEPRKHNDPHGFDCVEKTEAASETPVPKFRLR